MKMHCPGCGSTNWRCTGCDSGIGAEDEEAHQDCAEAVAKFEQVEAERDKLRVALKVCRKKCMYCGYWAGDRTEDNQCPLCLWHEWEARAKQAEGERDKLRSAFSEALDILTGEAWDTLAGALRKAGIDPATLEEG
jgi:hypothetical protein